MSRFLLKSCLKYVIDVIKVLGKITHVKQNNQTIMINKELDHILQYKNTFQM